MRTGNIRELQERSVGRGDDDDLSPTLLFPLLHGSEGFGGRAGTAECHQRQRRAGGFRDGLGIEQELRGGQRASRARGELLIQSGRRHSQIIRGAAAREDDLLEVCGVREREARGDLKRLHPSIGLGHDFVLGEIGISHLTSVGDRMRLALVE